MTKFAVLEQAAVFLLNSIDRPLVVLQTVCFISFVLSIFNHLHNFINFVRVQKAFCFMAFCTLLWCSATEHFHSVSFLFLAYSELYFLCCSITLCSLYGANDFFKLLFVLATFAERFRNGHSSSLANLSAFLFTARV